MNTKRIILAIGLLIGIVLLIAACKPIQKEVILTTGNIVGFGNGNGNGNGEICGETQCGDNQVCRGSQCFCADGFRTCQNTCIPSDGCCFDAECTSQSCVENVCEGEPEGPREPTYTPPESDVPKTVGECALLECRSNEICLDSGECGCREGTNWCNFQSKCILNNNCCHDGDCAGNDDCQLSGESLNICLELGNEELCKRLADDESRFFAFEEDSYSIEILKITDGGDVAYLKIDGKTYQPFKRFTAYTIPSGPRVVYDAYFRYGGRCE